MILSALLVVLLGHASAASVSVDGLLDLLDVQSVHASNPAEGVAFSSASSQSSDERARLASALQGMYESPTFLCVSLRKKTSSFYCP